MMKVIFVVDDDDAHRRACERMLKRAGYGVVSARNGAEALRTLAVTTVDLLLLDVFMPERDGFEVVEILRRKSQTFPVIAMSGGGIATPTQDVLEQIEKLGARQSLAKPFTEEALLRAVCEVFAVG